MSLLRQSLANLSQPVRRSPSQESLISGPREELDDERDATHGGHHQNPVTTTERFYEDDIIRRNSLQSSEEDVDEHGSFTPSTPRTRSKRYKKKATRSDLRASEGEFIEIPEMGKKKKNRKKLFKPQKHDGTSTPKMSSPFMHVHHVEGTSSVVHSPAAAVATSLDQQESEDDIVCSVARTALVLPFKYRSSITASTRWAEQLKARRISIGSENVPLWLPADNLPKEVGDLSPVFRAIFGTSARDGREKTWSCTRLILNNVVMKEIFGSPKLHTVQKGENYPYPVLFEGIELVLYPLGTALLVIHINWIPNPSLENSDLSLNELSSLIFVAKYKHMITDVCLGWGFSVDNENPMVSESVTESLGVLFDARYRNKTVSLGTLGNWLLHLPGEDPSAPPVRLDYSRHAMHHTCVVTNREPSKETVQHYLFVLRHAYGQKNRPPIDTAATLGKVLIWRANRYIGVSKEGSVSMSWSVSQSDHDFEITNWYRKFQGVFLLLNLHAVAEKLVLFELSDVAAYEAETLRLAEDVSLDEMRRYRNSLRHLASLVVRYTLAMSTNDCGGTSEYADFFTTCRTLYGIPGLRDELSNELKDVLAVVESNYLEEERRQNDLVEQNRKKIYAQQKIHEKERARQKDAFEISITIITSFTLPFVLVTGIFGMNLENLPITIDFWLVMGLTLLCSFILLAGILLMRYWIKKQVRVSLAQETVNEDILSRVSMDNNYLSVPTFNQPR